MISELTNALNATASGTMTPAILAIVRPDDACGQLCWCLAIVVWMYSLVAR